MISTQSLTSLCSNLSFHDDNTLYQRRFTLKNETKVVHISKRDDKAIRELLRAIEAKNITRIFYLKSLISPFVYKFLRDYFVEQTEDSMIQDIL